MRGYEVVPAYDNRETLKEKAFGDLVLWPKYVSSSMDQSVRDISTLFRLSTLCTNDNIDANVHGGGSEMVVLTNLRERRSCPFHEPRGRTDPRLRAMAPAYLGYLSTYPT